MRGTLGNVDELSALVDTAICACFSSAIDASFIRLVRCQAADALIGRLGRALSHHLDGFEVLWSPTSVWLLLLASHCNCGMISERFGDKEYWLLTWDDQVRLAQSKMPK